MSIDEAIHILDHLKPTDTKTSFDAYVVGHALTMAIKALKQYGALQEIRQDIEEERDGWIKWSDSEWHAFNKAVAIIDKHIKEIEG